MPRRRPTHAASRTTTSADGGRVLEIGEIELGYSELAEGRLVMSPSPALRHSKVCSRLWCAVSDQLPQDLAAALNVDVDLALAASDAPGFVRRPDLVVISGDAALRIDDEGGILRAADVLLAVEVVSPGSRRTDLVIKRGEYADAGIPHYWILDVTMPISLLACHLAGEFGYVDGGTVTGRFSTATPFAFEIDLDALR